MTDQAENPMPDVEEPTRRPTSILVVEDCDRENELTGRILEQHHYNVITATGVEAARAQVQKFLPDAVLLDVNLPDGDGYEFLKELRQADETAGLPVLLVTGRSKPADVIKSFGLGASDVISKPVNFDILLLRLRNQLKYHRRYQRMEQRLCSLTRLHLCSAATDWEHARALVEIELNRARRYCRPLCLIAVEVLSPAVSAARNPRTAQVLLGRHVQAALQFTIRLTDQLLPLNEEKQRYLAVLPETPAQEALMMASRLAAALRSSPITVEGERYNLWMKCGVATVNLDQVQGSQPSAADLITQAEKALENAISIGGSSPRFYDSSATIVGAYDPDSSDA